MFHIHISLLLEETKSNVTLCQMSERRCLHRNKQQSVKQQVTSKCSFLSANYLRLISDPFSVMLGQTRMSLLSAGEAKSSLATGGAARCCSEELSRIAGVVFQTTAGIKSSGFIGATLHPGLRRVHHFLCRRTRRHAKLNTQPHSTVIAAILAGKNGSVSRLCMHDVGKSHHLVQRSSKMLCCRLTTKVECFVRDPTSDL